MALNAQLAADVQSVADKAAMVRDKIRACRCGGDGTTSMVAFIDESTPYLTKSVFDMDALVYEDYGIESTVAFDVADDGPEELPIYPAGAQLPSGVSVHSCGRPPSLAELTEHVSAGIPGTPSRIVVAADVSGSMTDADVEPGLTDLIEWLQNEYAESEIELKFMGDEHWLLWAGRIEMEDCPCRAHGAENFPYADNAGRLVLSAERAASLQSSAMELAADHFWERYYAYADAVAADPENPSCPVWCPPAQCRLIADSGAGDLHPPAPGAIDADLWLENLNTLLDYMLSLFPGDGSCPPLCSCTGVPPVFRLCVLSEGPLDSEGVDIAVGIGGQPSGSTPYCENSMVEGREVSLEAAEEVAGCNSEGDEGTWLFDRWSGDYFSETTSMEFVMPAKDVFLTAEYVFEPDSDSGSDSGPDADWRCYVSRTWLFGCTENNAVRVVYTTSSQCMEKGAGSEWYGNHSDGSSKIISYRMETAARCPCDHAKMVGRMDRSGPSVEEAAAMAGFDGCGNAAMRCWHTYIIAITCEPGEGLSAGPRVYRQGWVWPGPVGESSHCLPDDAMPDHYLVDGHMEPNFIIRGFSDGNRERDYNMDDKCVYPGDLLVVLMHQPGWPCRPSGF